MPFIKNTIKPDYECHRCIESYSDEEGVHQKGKKEPSKCAHCKVCENCEHLIECITNELKVVKQ